MISNLKVDIIYYKTSSDFELEFNLSGCCRMRIFKDKVDSPKMLVNTLARDVSRSRIIILVTDLIGDKNGVEIVSGAIGYNYEPVDKLAHSIKSGDNIKAPKGALPLVSKTGQYGGCIIECGKQSIIMVSSDRPLRHEVMRTYIHQYIFDINQVEAYNERLRHESSSNPIIEGSNILSSARQDLSSHTSQPNDFKAEESEINDEDTTEENCTEQENAQSIAEQEEPSNFETAEEDNVSDDTDQEPIEQEPQSEQNEDDDVIRSSSEGFVAMLSNINDSDTHSEEASNINRNIRRRPKGANIALLIITIFLLICFGLLAYYFVYVPIITGGELPNDFVRIISEVISWNT